MLDQDIFTISTEREFEVKALEVFRYQYQHLAIYQKFCDLLKIAPEKVTALNDIPFLPIQFFKQQAIISREKISEVIFSSSGTTGSITSKHHVAKLALYEASFRAAFNHFYGELDDWTILALLPSYLERQGSSLIYMFDQLIKGTHNPDSGFYLNNVDELIAKLHLLEKKGRKTLLLGVSYALLDLIEKHQFKLKHTVVMETGGMKGQRKELVREQLHQLLKEGFGVSQIHSEYGMTELLSQAYSQGEGVFSCPAWMKVLIRDPEDPLSLLKNRTGGINIIDLANVYSCSFLATQDLGRLITDTKFEILGRFDTSDIRGCNLMVL